MGVIYRIRNTSDGKFYLGSSINVNQRFSAHKSLLRRNCHFNAHLQRAWNLFGENSFCFEIIGEWNDEVIREKEQEYLNECYGTEKCYNLSRDTNSPMKGVLRGSPTKETRDKISKSQKGKIIPNEVKQKISASLKGHSYNKGYIKTKEHIEKIRVSQTGRSVSEETKNKISNAQRGRVQTKEWINKRSGENTKRAILTNEIVLAMRALYIPRVVTIKDIAERFNQSYSTVQKVLNRITWKHI